MSTTALTLHDLVLARLKAMTAIQVFDGSVDDAGQGPVSTDPDGRAHMYAVLYMSPGRSYANNLAGIPDTLGGSWQVTCAGGDVNRALRAAVKVRAALTGVRLAATTGLVHESTDPGPVREDPSIVPSRWLVPVLFDVLAI